MLINFTYLGLIFSDVDVDKPDEKSIMTYVAQFLKQYPDVHSTGSDGQEIDVSICFSLSTDNTLDRYHPHLGGNQRKNFSDVLAESEKALFNNNCWIYNMYNMN